MCFCSKKSELLNNWFLACSTGDTKFVKLHLDDLVNSKDSRNFNITKKSSSVINHQDSD